MTLAQAPWGSHLYFVNALALAAPGFSAAMKQNEKYP